jgi:anti-anti-sigma factor
MHYISSAGIGSLISAAKECEKKRGQVRLSGLQKEVFKVFQLLKFDLLFRIHADVKDALADF